MKYSTAVIDRPTLITYIQRCLGIKDHDIELEEEEYNDVVDDVMQEFLEFAFDGSEIKYILLNATEGIKEYSLPDEVISVIDVFGGSIINPVTMSAFYNRISDDLYSQSAAGYTYLDYQISTMFINDNIDALTSPIMFNYNGTTKTLRIFDNNVTRVLMLKVITYAGEESGSGENLTTTFNNLYNHKWVKQKCEAVAFQRWYQLLIKFKGKIFDGDIEIDKEAIGILAEKLNDKADKDLLSKYTNTIGMYNK